MCTRTNGNRNTVSEFNKNAAKYLGEELQGKPSGRTFSLRRNVSLITFRFLFHRNAAIFLWTLNATGCNEVTFAS